MTSGPPHKYRIDGRRCDSWTKGLERIPLTLNRKSELRGVREKIEATGAKLWLLPPYSPDLNPRAVVRKTQSPVAQGRRALGLSTLGSHRNSPQFLHTAGMPELLHQRWIWCNLIGIRLEPRMTSWRPPILREPIGNEAAKS
jgi:hypothetical protein